MTKKEHFENLQKKCKDIYLDEPMSKHTSFKIGGNADIFIKANKMEEIEFVQKYAKENKIKLHVIGNGSNVLVSDSGIEGIVLKIATQDIKIEEDKEGFFKVKIDAGVNLALASIMLAKKGLSGFEELSGIPGTIAGAIRMNAGAYGKEIKDILISTRVLDQDGKIIELSNEEQELGYRTSIFAKKNYIILDAKFYVKKANEEEIKNKMNEYMQKRKMSQPTEYPSAGSTFKRGDGFITAKEIDECGLKGYKIGGAEISKKHAGFIVNVDRATAKDVLDLINYVKNKVYKDKGIKIEEEVEFIGRK